MSTMDCQRLEVRICRSWQFFISYHLCTKRCLTQELSVFCPLSQLLPAIFPHSPLLCCASVDALFSFLAHLIYFLTCSLCFPFPLTLLSPYAETFRSLLKACLEDIRWTITSFFQVTFSHSSLPHEGLSRS